MLRSQIHGVRVCGFVNSAKEREEMSEPRLIDANEIVEVAERAWNAWNLAMATQDTNQGINKVLKRQELCKAVKAVAEGAPTIDPETLPIVQELRKELEWVKKERDEIATLCGKLGVLCDQPQKKRQELFLKYRGSMIGDYMGSGYPFVDAFNRIIDDFMLAMSDGAYKAVMEAAHKEIQSKIKPSEVQKDE